MMLRKLWKSWRGFWFEPRSPLPLAVFRILFGLLVIQNAVMHTWPGFLSWYGSSGLISIEDIIRHNWGGSPRFDILLMLPAGDHWIVAVFWLYVVAAFFLTIGFCTRYSAAFLALALISFHHHNVFNLNSGDTFQRLASIFLSFSPAGEALSVDVLLRRRRGEATGYQLYSPWAQRMIQVQVAIIYCHSFLSKIVGPEWLDGTAVYYATRIDEMIRFPMTFLYDNLWVCKILTWYTLLVEFSMWTLVWVRKFRYYVLASAVMLHLGIDATFNLPIFEWTMIVSFITFVEPEDLLRVLEALKKAVPGKLYRRRTAD